jgi:hypothetical protein
MHPTIWITTMHTNSTINTAMHTHNASVVDLNDPQREREDHDRQRRYESEWMAARAAEALRVAEAVQAAEAAVVRARSTRALMLGGWACAWIISGIARLSNG